MSRGLADKLHHIYWQSSKRENVIKKSLMAMKLPKAAIEEQKKHQRLFLFPIYLFNLFFSIRKANEALIQKRKRKKFFIENFSSSRDQH